jgi:hypothetical protein
MAVNISQLAFQSGLALTQSSTDYKQHRDAGDTPASAGFKAGSSFLANSTLSVPGAIAVGLGAGVANLAVRGIANGIIGRNNRIHSMAIPFSQQFHHNEMTMHLQSYGLSQMGASGALGNEASMMYGRYGR